MKDWKEEYNELCDKLEKEGVYLRDKAWRMNAGILYKIQDKSGKTVPFIMTEIQEEIHKEIDGHGRVVVLKGRQIMATTVVMIDFLDDCLFEDNMVARTIADSENTIEILFKKVKFAYDHLPVGIRKMFPLEASNKYEIKIKRRNSHYLVCLGLHGETVRDLHFSEVSFILEKDMGKRVDESLEAVPQGIGKTKIVYESIANGSSGSFADMYRQARDGQSSYHALFFEWFRHYEYQKAVTDVEREIILETLNDDEKKLMANKGLSVERIAWRREKIDGIRGSTYEEKLEIFKVKYPENDKDCFLSTGSQVFSPRLVDMYKEDPEACFLKPIARYTFDHNDVFKDCAMGEIEIYAHPEEGREYVLGADVSEGTTKGDKSKAYVLEKGTSKPMCRYNAVNTKPEIFGTRCVTVGAYYNYAEIAIESNFRDSCVKEVVRRRYPNIYYNRKEEGHKLSSYGWNTNERSKRLIIDQFKFDFEGRLWDRLPESLILEMEKYVELENGRTEASEGFDDEIMSFSICNYLSIKMHSFIKRKTEEEKDIGYKMILNDKGVSIYTKKKRKGVDSFNYDGI